MAIYTLTSDWHNNDYYVGAVKGKIFSKDISSVVVDISHKIAPFGVMQAAFILRNCYKEYPAGTIHIIAVNAVLSPSRNLLIVENAGQYFLCSDTGFPDLMFPNQDIKVYSYKVGVDEGNTFASLEVFIEVGNKLAKGEKPSAIATETTEYVHQVPWRPTIDNKLINGSVVYIDSFSNAITNITRETFERIGEGYAFEIFVQSNHYVIDTISKSYLDIATGDLMALFNSSDLLEIAIANGPAAELLNLKLSSTIRVKFKNTKPQNTLF